MMQKAEDGNGEFVLNDVLLNCLATERMGDWTVTAMYTKIMQIAGRVSRTLPRTSWKRQDSQQNSGCTFGQDLQGSEAAMKIMHRMSEGK